MSDRSGDDHLRSGKAEGRHSRRTFVSHAATGAAAAAAAVGIAVAVDDDAPDRSRLTTERLRLTTLPGAGLVYDVRDYGAQGDGQTDDTTAVQSAIHAATDKGGAVYFPIGTYVIGKTLVCDKNAKGFTLCGAGGGLQFDRTPSVLLYTGSQSGPSGGLMTFNSSLGFEVCHLAFNYSNTAFRGDLINIDGEPHHADTQDFHIHHCSSKAVGGSFTARSIVRLNKAVIGTISHCHLTGTSGNAIRIGDPGGSYVNAFQVEKCTFNWNEDGHILLGTADGENLVIRDCSFEAGTNTTAIRGATMAHDGGRCQLYSPVIETCWAGDASAATKWIDGLYTTTNDFVGTIRGCLFGNAGGGMALTLDGTWLVEGCSFDGGSVFSTDSGLNLTAIGNFYNAFRPGELIFDPAKFKTWPASYVSLGNRSATAPPSDPRGPTDPRNAPAAANRITALQA